MDDLRGVHRLLLVPKLSRVLPILPLSRCISRTGSALLRLARGQRLVKDCVPQPQLKRGTARALCLPPEYDCKFVSTDETTKILDCTLLPFKGTVYTPPQDTKLYIGQGDFLHPDLALRLTVPFFLSLDSQ